MTLRTEILAWIMGEVIADEHLLIQTFGQDSWPELASLMDLGVVVRSSTRKGFVYEVTKIWAKPNGNGTGSKR